MHLKSNRVTIGMMRQFKKPNHLVVSAAHAAYVLGCDFIFFNPQDVSFSKNEINALKYKDGKWLRKAVNFPDVIDNSPSKQEDKEVYAKLEKIIPLTMRRIGNKDIINSRILNDEVFDELIIPFEKITRIEDIIDFIEKNGKVVIKPRGGNRGNNIFYAEKVENNFLLKSSDSIIYWDQKEITPIISKFIDNRYILQKYIPSRTKHGLPFDIRIHLRRGKQGKWRTVKMYPRIGNGADITSNLSQGGSISKINSFLRYNYDEKWKSIKTKLNNIATDFPKYFQRNYKRPIDAIGIDIGLDENGKPWLFEVNSYPGSSMFELEAQIIAMEYALFLANNRKSYFENTLEI